MGHRLSPVASPTAKEQAFLQAKEMGMKDTEAAAFAGYSNPTAEVTRLKKKPHIRVALQALAEMNQREMQISRQDVQSIVLEAVEMSRLQADPMAMVRAAQELNKMCGFYAAEVKEVRLSTSQEQRQRALENMSDQELLELADSGGGFDVVLEGEFENITDTDTHADKDTR